MRCGCRCCRCCCRPEVCRFNPHRPSRFARSSGNRRERIPGRRSRGLPGDLAGRAAPSARLPRGSSSGATARTRGAAGPGPVTGPHSETLPPAPAAGAGRARLAQCEPSATRSTPPRAVRAQRDGIRLSSIRASPPRTMRPEVTSPIRLPRGRGADGQRGPRRGRVRICCKGAPRRDRPRRKARNINDSLRASRRDPGLCNRFGQTAPRGPRERRRGPGGDHGGRRPGLRTGAPG